MTVGEGRFGGKVVLISGTALGQGAAHEYLSAEEGAILIAADVLDDAGNSLRKGFVMRASLRNEGRGTRFDSCARE